GFLTLPRSVLAWSRFPMKPVARRKVKLILILAPAGRPAREPSDDRGAGAGQAPEVPGATIGAVHATGNPLAELRLFVDPDSNARRQADKWRSERPEDARHMDTIASAPQGEWFGGWSGDVRAAVDREVTAATADGAVALLVAYNIPERDCGNHSAGGLASADAYRAWIRAFGAGIGDRRAIVVLEPDALALMDCLSREGQAARTALLKDAIAVLESHPNVATYVDAGHSAWHSAEVMTARLKAVGVGRADGFSLNVSNFRLTSGELVYGAAISEGTGGTHFVIDTSRNGAGSLSTEWCNPRGRALGERPTTLTGQPLADAYLWVKRPGESDGSCNEGPLAGSWWPEYALGLAQRSA
ncbi:MAG: glycoside hydrolase family 6 protein, partial [Actinomycetota bacterium]|nr:glycoside hydrolase family 6 protein [Actinomycetota bacterium]